MAGMSTLRRRVVAPSAAAVVVGLVVVGVVRMWPAVVEALPRLGSPELPWLAAAVVAGLAVMGAHARMQRHLLMSAGVRVSLRRHVAMAFAAHSLSATLPGGPAFSTRFNYQQMRRFGASPAIASWCITLSGVLSSVGLAVVAAVGAAVTSGSVRWGNLLALLLALVLLTLGMRRLRRHPGAWDQVAGWAVGVVNRVRHRPSGQGLDRVRGFIGQLGAARLTPVHAAAALAYAVLNWTLDALCLWLCVAAVGGEGPVAASQVLLAFCAGMAAGTLTLVPAGIGVIDGALVLGLVAGGIGTTTAIAAVVAYRLISFGLVAGAGWVVWAVMRARSRVEVESASEHVLTI